MASMFGVPLQAETQFEGEDNPVVGVMKHTEENNDMCWRSISPTQEITGGDRPDSVFCLIILNGFINDHPFIIRSNRDAHQ